MNFLSMTGISKKFDGVPALRGACLQVERAEVHALVGENGAGKSTLMKILAGVYPADEGAIHWQGNSLKPRNYHEALQVGISMIFQDPSLFESLSVAENLLLDRLPRHWSGFISYHELWGKADALLREMNFDISARCLVRNLSVAERQLVEITKAVAIGAGLVIMDEPTASLNLQESECLFRLINHLKNSGVSVVYISHRLDEVMQISDRLTVLRDGEVIGTWQTAEISQQAVIQKMVGRSVDLFTSRRRAGLADGAAMLEVDRLSVPGKLTEVSFLLRKGEILGVAGLRGSGQQFLVRALLGVQPHQGTLRVAGEVCAMKSPRQAAALGLAYVTDDRKSEGLLPEMTASYNGTLGSISEITRGGFLWPRLERQLGDKQIKEFSIRTKSSSIPVKHFSGGNQQKVLLARVLEQKPRILMLNEPTCGIDLGAKEEIYRLIGRLASGGMSILMISSELGELLALADRILVLNNKRPSTIIPSELATDAAVMEAAVT